MNDRQQAESEGFTVDTHCYPWFAYKGPRFRPDESKSIRTDLECSVQQDCGADRQVEALADRAEFYADHYASKNITQAELREFAAALRSRTPSAPDGAMREACRQEALRRATRCENDLATPPNIRGLGPDNHALEYGKRVEFDIVRDIAALSASEAKAGEPVECCVPRNGEPSFVLLGRDPQAPALVERWAGDRARYEPESDKPAKARQIASDMRVFKAANPSLGMATPAPTPPQVDREAVARLAHRFWSIHPGKIQAMGITRKQFYEREILSLLAPTALAQEG